MDWGWIGGASCRGLKKERNRSRVVGTVADQLARKDVDSVVVFLAYGSVDVDWNVPYKQHQGQEVDPQAFVAEMVQALMLLVNELQGLEGGTTGRLTLVLTFPYTPIVLSKNFMHDDAHFAALGIRMT